MSVTLLTSASGSPGVTTTAIGLTVHWPESCLLVDADYQQAVLAGYLQGRQVPASGIVHVINAARISPNVREAVWRQSVPLPDGRSGRTTPTAASRAGVAQTADALRQSWLPIATALQDLDDAGIDIIIDLGRLTPIGIPPALLNVASQVLLMSKPTMRAVGACHWAAQRLADQAEDVRAGSKIGLLMVRRPALSTAAITGADPTERGYSNAEIEEFLPLKVVASIHHDPANARLLSDGGTRSPKYDRSGYANSLVHLAQRLAGPVTPRTVPHPCRSRRTTDD